MTTKTLKKEKLSLAKKLYFWIQFYEDQKKIWLHLFIPGDAGNTKNKLERYLTNGNIIMDLQDELYPRGHGAWNWDIISIEDAKHDFPTYRNYDHETALSPEEKDKNTAIQKLAKSKKPIPITNKELEIQDDGTIDLKLSLPKLNIDQKIDFPSIWNSLEKNYLGKIKEGDLITLKDDDGNKLFELRGGSYLNVGIADLKIYDTAKRKGLANTIFNDLIGLKGGAFIRDDGRIVVGDLDRTFYLEIYTQNLLKAALKLNKSMIELTQTKLLDK